MPGPYPKPRACEGCSYEHVGGGFVAPDPIPPTPRPLLVYGEAPGRDEEIEGKGFVGRSGRLLRGALKRGGIPESNVAFSNAILCRPPWNEFPGLAVANECARRHPRPFMQGPFRGNILACGGNAIQALGGVILPPLNVRGTMLPLDGFPGWFTGTVHPAFISRVMDEGSRKGAGGKAMEELYPFLALDASRAAECREPRVPRVEVVTVAALRERFMAEYGQIGFVSVDIEGKDGVPKIIGFSWKRGHALVLEWDDAIVGFLKAIPKLLLGHNMTYDLGELRQVGFDPPPLWLDTINSAALIDPSIKHGLQAQVLSWVPGSVAWKGLINHTEGPDFEGGDVGFWRDMWREVLARLGRRIPASGQEWYYFYNGLDVAWTYELFERHFEILKKEGRQEYYTQVLMPLQTSLLEMGERGMPFDKAAAERHVKGCLRVERMAKRIVDQMGRAVLLKRFTDAENEVNFLVHVKERENSKKFSRAAELTKARGKFRDAKVKLEEGFNIESNKQRTELVYGYFGLPVQRNDAGNPTADEDALLELKKRLERVGFDGKPDPTIKPKIGTRADAVRVLHALIAGKKWPHWRRNYLNPPLKETETGPYLITSYTAHRADTGRLASGIDVSDPEKQSERVQQVQNVPKKLRDVVRAEPGRVFIGADWAGIEWALVMWFAAKIDNPKGYHLRILESFQAGELDPHRFLASIAFGKPVGAVTSRERTLCKPYTHGYNYDGSPWTLAQAAGHPRSVGVAVCKGHDQAYKTRPWKDATVQEATTRKFVQTPLGWRRWFWGLQPKPTEILATLIQATAADLMKWVLVRMPKGADRPLDYRLMTTTHDSVMIDVPEKEAELGKQFLEAQMQQPIEWLEGRTWRCEVKAGQTWRAVS